MIKVIYTEDGQVISDQKLEEWAEKIVKRFKKTKKDFTIKVGAGLMIDMLRVFVVRGKLNHTDVIFLNGEDEIPIIMDKNAHLNNWPKGFCDINEKLLSELIGWL